MKVTFKDVGQGDSIILEWESKGASKIGIIDCCKHEGKNPILDHLKALNWKSQSIDFILLSHPHYDHYSGMLELLDYCLSNNIKIERFGHSLSVEQRYLDWANTNNKHNSRLEKLIDRVIQMEKNGEINEIAIVAKDWSIQLSEKHSIRSISPSDKEWRSYTERVDVFKNDRKRASKEANLFSTILIFESSEAYFLLTSDATTEALDRILDRSISYFKDKNLVLGQVPHHGSKYNHRIQFWRKLKPEINTYVAISAGSNSNYNHPDIKVVESFRDNDFKVYSTIHRDVLNERAERKSAILNTASNILYGTFGDQAFKIEDGIAIYLS